MVSLLGQPGLLRNLVKDCGKGAGQFLARPKSPRTWGTDFRHETLSGFHPVHLLFGEENRTKILPQENKLAKSKNTLFGFHPLFYKILATLAL